MFLGHLPMHVREARGRNPNVQVNFNVKHSTTAGDGTLGSASHRLAMPRLKVGFWREREEITPSRCVTNRRGSLPDPRPPGRVDSAQLGPGGIRFAVLVMGTDGLVAAAEARLLAAAEGRGDITFGEAVDRHGAGSNGRSHAVAGVDAVGPERGGEALASVVGNGDGFFFGVEGDDHQDRVECLANFHLLAGLSLGAESRRAIEAAVAALPGSPDCAKLLALLFGATAI